MAVEVLGRGFNGRLLKAVRERLGAAYGISAVLQTVDAGTRALFIHTPVANDKAREALATIRSEYARFVADGVTDEELIEWCRGRLARFKVPESVRFVAEIPRNGLGKIQKQDLVTEVAR